MAQGADRSLLLSSDRSPIRCADTHRYFQSAWSDRWNSAARCQRTISERVWSLSISTVVPTSSPHPRPQRSTPTGARDPLSALLPPLEVSAGRADDGVEGRVEDARCHAHSPPRLSVGCLDLDISDGQTWWGVGMASSIL